MVKLSEKLQRYIQKVEDETGRDVIIEPVRDHGLPGMKASFSVNPKYIHVRISPVLHSDQLENSIAHEVTHGFLAYAKGYCRAKIKGQLNEVEKRSLEYLINVIEDIVVNKVIYEEGFQPYADNYLSEVINETKAARKGKDYYKERFQELIIKNRFMIYRLIMAWGYLEYYDLEKYAQRTIHKFVKAFQAAYPTLYSEADEVENIILQNDIFSADGFQTALEQSLKLWGLDNLVELENLQ